MPSDDYRWHYDYPRLAWDSGFTFQAHPLKSSLDKNIGHLDIEQVIRERDIATIEKYIGTVIDFTLDSDQTSVLDPSFVKVFRISQLSVQYLLFCKKYLDNTVVLLKREFQNNNEETKNLKLYVEELRQEAANSKKHIKELKSALNCQIASTQNVPVFQCSECSKAFSTEEYLLAHTKRRHESLGAVGVPATSFQAETDKLQLEIKALKERLNNTEKFIHKDELDRPVKNLTPSSHFVSKNNNEEKANTVLADLQHKFELLKAHVENELQVLQTQKFDQEKYEKWFETFINKLEQTYLKDGRPCCAPTDKNTGDSGDAATEENKTIGQTDLREAQWASICKVCQEKFEVSDEQHNNIRKINRKQDVDAINARQEIAKNDSTTQTEFAESPEHTVCSNCRARHPPSFKIAEVKLLDNQTRSIFSNTENAQPKLPLQIENHLEKFEEILQQKVTSSIEKLEKQMQSICSKMSAIEQEKLQKEELFLKNQHQNSHKGNASAEADGRSPNLIPTVRKKRVLDNSTPKVAFAEKAKKPLLAEVIKTLPTLKKPSTKTVILKKAGANYSFNSDSDSESNASEESASSEESSESESDEQDVIQHSEALAPSLKPSKMSTLGQRSLTSLKEAAFTPAVLHGLQKELENILDNRLEDLGVSPDWSTLPVRSYKRAIAIVNHQANLIQKNVSNYMHIRGQLLKDVDKRALEQSKGFAGTQRHLKLKSLLSSVKNKAKIIVKNEPKHSSKSANIKPPTTLPQLQKRKIETKPMPEKNRDAGDDKPNVKMYAADLESEDNVQHRTTPAWNQQYITDQAQKAYSNVIQELNKAVNTKSQDEEEVLSEILSKANSPDKEERLTEQAGKDESESDRHSDARMEMQAKGVLKNYPSTGSLQKKRVLFDLEFSDASIQNEAEKEKPPAVIETNVGGSTSSCIVLDGSKTNLTQNASEKKHEDLSDVSDWDLSEILD